ncbi:hypothetical protein AKO1_006881, partial [Acrasis kona]
MSEENSIEDFKEGDKVQWNYAGNQIQGTVVDIVDKPMDIKSHHVDASKSDPEVLVKSDKTGKKAAHRPESIQKLDDQGEDENEQKVSESQDQEQEA